MKIMSYAKNIGRYFFAIALAAGMASCDGIYDSEGDCSVTYRVRFRYDKNMKFADAFSHEVKSVTLYAIDNSGKVVWQKTEQGDALAADNYSMLMDVAPGEYELLAWCGLEEGKSFTVPEVKLGETAKEELTCKLNREHSEDGSAFVKDDIKSLFHGHIRAVLPDEAGTHTVTVPLMKNTNNVRVVLQHLSGETVDEKKFTFSITAENGMMDWDNSLMRDEMITYYAWNITSGTAGVEKEETKAVTQVSAAIAELTTSRLMKGSDTRLTIRNDEGGTVLSIPLIDYALLVKGNYNKGLDDQDYLDRQDEYSMVFFLDKDDRWINSHIYINSWKVVLQHSDI